MSHDKVRSEKICLNCGTDTPGRYCPSCGQQNVEPKQTVWHLVQHFLSDVTHFDGKFFVTVKDLFAKPGFLSKEYVIGRRASYLDPIRMYIFTSAIFFLIFFSLFDVKKMPFVNDSKIKGDPGLKQMLANAKTAEDSAEVRKEYDSSIKPFVQLVNDSVAKKRKGLKVSVENDYPSVAAYDSIQKTLPLAQRDKWMMRRYMHRKIEIGEDFDRDPGAMIREWISVFLHNFPKVLFISLPVFALLLKLLYLRRKQFYYTDHGIFSIHLFIFTFLVLLVSFAVNSLHNYTHWGILKWVIGIILLYPFFYYYKAMRRFYGQSRRKTIVKYILLLGMAFIIQLTIFTIAFVISVLEV